MNELELIRIKDIPVDCRLEEVVLNMSKAFKIMKAIHAGRYNEAFDLAEEIVTANDLIIDQRIGREKLKEILNKSQNPELN
ncbi:MAG: hypothetical protein AB2L20_30140 [Mangrovibacterium sp.]